MILVIAKKELREIARDGRFRGAAAIVVLLLALALASGWSQARRVQAERDGAQAVAREHWEEQGDKNPHVAAHYGIHVFKPEGPLSYVDPGVSPYLGVSLKLQAHQQSLAENSAAQDGTGIQRLGGLSVATVLQLLVPLLIIALGFGVWTSERERGTLRQVMSLGVKPRTLLAGKALGLTGALTGLLGPPALLIAAGLALSGAEGTAMARLVASFGVYAAYFGVFVAAALYVSARAGSSRGALVALVGFWGLTALVVPRAATEVAGLLVPLPSSDALAKAVRTSLEEGLPGGPAKEERVDELTRALLGDQDFEGAEMFMDEALLGGLELQAEAAFENEVFDHHFGAFMDSVARQERVVQWAGLLSPFVAARTASMAFAGTDYAHHRAFVASAEAYRRAIVRAMNEDFAANAGTDGWEYKAGPEVWAKAPKFEYTPPQVSDVLRDQLPSLAMLFGWFLAAAAGAAVAARRVRVV
jgi:ABC-2 type transport system permease protein